MSQICVSFTYNPSDNFLHLDPQGGNFFYSLPGLDARLVTNVKLSSNFGLKQNDGIFFSKCEYSSKQQVFQVMSAILGCCLSPTSFKFYKEHVLRDWKRKHSIVNIPQSDEETLLTSCSADYPIITTQDQEDAEFIIWKLVAE